MTDWDYIVVGGGTAGAILAARLTEDPASNVLVLEAGPDYRSADTPTQFHDRNLGRGLALQPPREEQNPEFFFSGITARRTPEQAVFPYRRGRGLGGSSTINGLCAIRGVPDDFALWQQMGADGWGYDDLLPSFRASETDAQFPGSPWHGHNGPIPVYREPESGWGGTDIALRDAALAAGYGWHDDHNAPTGTGATTFAMNIRDGKRVSTNDAYLDPARDRANLTVVGGAHVDRVLFDGMRAVGLRLADGAEHRVAAGGEVLLCAGAIHSPAILLRSGIGPEAELQRLGAERTAILPVGEGHQDHAVVFIEVPVDPSSQQCVGNRPTNVVVRYSSGLAGAHENDMMLMASNHNYWFGLPTAGVAVQLNQAFSRGEFRLPSLDPFADPHLEMHLLGDERDLVRMRDGVDRIRALLEHPAMKRLATGPAVLPEDASLRHAVKDVMHACSTARMGAPGDPEAVVDSECRVLGIDGLRVVDASIMPTTVSANLFLTVVAIAERMAERLTGRSHAPASTGEARADQPAEHRTHERSVA
ncbi:glucose-methanol-choline oxidoreductase [Pseudoclavibacter endophyticus]|uniref:GMC oxidoreductase n=1 Tax=Pseudoclavibacter endophyticus TaxID=1778590 RepID=A0A6H9WJ98_9MICO|nr:GMC family oxidoreductase N-terminal domain-containing protein [Pseudoclavibacter endophyticus]KAB1646903.1 GMC oxidoreductase [Pseudoclavibacter endophyticus]GGA74567.1 glucose-methanol-choline oxidoreductase [Pseudoclavibacter endophyticus]